MPSKFYCRLYQAVLKIGNYFMGYKTPDYKQGFGSIKELAPLIIKQGGKKVLVVTDKSLIELNLLNSMLKSFDENKIEYVIFSNVNVNPTTSNVEEGNKIYKDNNCDCLVGFGGGSPIDCAKAIGARIVNPKKSVSQLQGLLKVRKKIPPFFAIPTTSGTGSETTLAAVITDSDTHLKKSINDPHILPKYAILDPQLTLGLPKTITATTGMDALTHAVEAYLNHTYNTKLENTLAKRAVKLVYDNLLTAYNDGSNIQARENMQMAAFFAGRAFTRGCVGYVHAIGHTLGGLYNVPHGLAMAIILPHILKKYGCKVYKRLSQLAICCGIDGDSDKERAQKFIKWIEDLKVKLDIPEKLDMIKEEDIDQIIEWADKEANPLYPVPVIFTKDDFKDVIHSMMSDKNEEK